MVVLAQAQQLAACQGVVSQIEGGLGFLFGVDLCLGFWIGTGAQIVFAEPEADVGGVDDLHRLVLVQADAGTQGGVASNDAVQCMT